MKKTYKSILVVVSLLVLLFLCLFNTKIVIHEIINYSKLFLTKLFPVTFIFFILSSLLIDYGIIQLINKYFNINSSNLYILIISMISGFPSGAKYTRELFESKLINVSDANNIIKFSHFPNPLFVIGSVYLVLGDKSLCFKILFSIIISNLIIFIFSKKSTNKINYNYDIPNDFSKVLSKAINNSFNTLILIFGTSLFFYLISIFITNCFSFNSYLYVFINGLFDLTKGAFSTTLISDVYIRSLFILFFISFGGLSIHMQVKSILADTFISYKCFIIGRIIGTILSFVIFNLLVLF